MGRTAEVTGQRQSSHSGRLPLRAADFRLISSVIKAPAPGPWVASCCGRETNFYCVRPIETDTKGHFPFGSVNWDLKSSSEGLALSTAVHSAPGCRVAPRLDLGWRWPPRGSSLDFSSSCLSRNWVSFNHGGSDDMKLLRVPFLLFPEVIEPSRRWRESWLQL